MRVRIWATGAGKHRVRIWATGAGKHRVSGSGSQRAPEVIGIGVGIGFRGMVLVAALHDDRQRTVIPWAFAKLNKALTMQIAPPSIPEWTPSVYKPRGCGWLGHSYKVGD